MSEHCRPTRAERVTIKRREATYSEWHFAEATRVGDLVWVSGQRGFDERDETSDDPDHQARVAFENVEAALAAAGASMGDIVSLTSYHTDMADVDGFRAVKDEFIGLPYPSWTVVGVAALADPAMRVEISAVAVIGADAPPPTGSAAGTSPRS